MESSARRSFAGGKGSFTGDDDDDCEKWPQRMHTRPRPDATAEIRRKCFKGEDGAFMQRYSFSIRMEQKTRTSELSRLFQNKLNIKCFVKAFQGRL